MPTLTATNLTVDREVLLGALVSISSVVPTKSPKPVLRNVCVTPANDYCDLCATDLDVGIRLQFAFAGEIPDHGLLLPFGKLRQIVSLSRCESICFEPSNDKIVISDEQASFTLPTEDPRNYPDVPSFSGENYLAVPQAELRQAIRRTQFACDPESTRFALAGAWFEQVDSGLVVVGTDGRRLAHQSLSAQQSGTGVLNQVIPLKALRLLDRVLNDDEAPVLIAIDKSRVAFKSQTWTIFSRLVEGRFPDYRMVFPAAPATTARITVGPLRSAVEQAAIITSEESRGISFDFSDGNLRLSGQASDVGETKVDVPVAVEGPPVDITFDPRYVVDCLKQLNDDDELTIALIDAKNAAVIRTGEYSYVVMPLTKDR